MRKSTYDRDVREVITVPGSLKLNIREGEKAGCDGSDTHGVGEIQERGRTLFPLVRGLTIIGSSSSFQCSTHSERS